MPYYDTIPVEPTCQLEELTDVICLASAIRSVCIAGIDLNFCIEHYELALREARKNNDSE
jgi:hypothetical protein